MFENPEESATLIKALMKTVFRIVGLRGRLGA